MVAPQASCSVTELLRHDQRHTFSASPRDLPLREHLSNPTLFPAATIRLPNVSPELTYLTEGEISRDRLKHNSHQMSAVHPEADINQSIASA